MLGFCVCQKCGRNDLPCTWYSDKYLCEDCEAEARAADAEFMTDVHTLLELQEADFISWKDTVTATPEYKRYEGVRTIIDGIVRLRKNEESAAV